MTKTIFEKPFLENRFATVGYKEQSWFSLR